MGAVTPFEILNNLFYLGKTLNVTIKIDRFDREIISEEIIIKPENIDALLYLVRQMNDKQKILEEIEKNTE